VAIRWKIPLVVYGENVSWEYGGVLQDETYSAQYQIKNDVVKTVDWDFWHDFVHDRIVVAGYNGLTRILLGRLT
jgi:hypothetical protein